MKRLLAICLIIMFALSLSACTDGISKDEAKAHISGFLEKVSTDDYKAAEEFLHPERPADLQAFFDGIESENEIDFSNISIEKYTGFKSSLYDSTVNGSAYSLTMDVSSSGKSFQMEIEIVENDNGYGIYNLDIDFD